MDRNLGAGRVATSNSDADAYGDLYQWGRRADGHQCRNSPTVTTLSSTDQPAHGSFIVVSDIPNDWRSPQNNNLWQRANGVNNPCPLGYRIPTIAEWEEERLSWPSQNFSGAFNSPLKLTRSGYRSSTDGSLTSGSSGFYWSWSGSGNYLRFTNTNASTNLTLARANGLSVRCIKAVPGTVINIDCGATTNNGSLIAGIAASGVSSTVPYAGGNGGDYNEQIVASAGVMGLTATLAAGSFANGAGSLTVTITGTPNATGTASFSLNIDGNLCNIIRSILPLYPEGTVHCGGIPTLVADVTNPNTGKTWMDRNLGASRVALSSTDADAYGDLYQWGRRADGHQCRNSPTTTTLSSTDQPTHGSFIVGADDWRSPQNSNLWQGANGVNNPCPTGYRLPTSPELEAERLTWSSQNPAGAFASPLKLTVGGWRNYTGTFVGRDAFYFSSSRDGALSMALKVQDQTELNISLPANGFSVRCIKD